MRLDLYRVVELFRKSIPQEVETLALLLLAREVLLTV